MTNRVAAAVCAVALGAVVTSATVLKLRTPTRPTPVRVGGRYLDNGDGTVTDTQTGLMWEQKTGTPGAPVDCAMLACSNPHDVNNVYKWSPGGADGNGGLFTDFLPRLNGALCATPPCTALGGHRDWRLPTITELQAIVDRTQGDCGSAHGACLHPVFGPTAIAFYWACTQATGQAHLPTPGGYNTGGAWVIGFGSGDIGDSGSRDGPYSRAVRGG